MSKTILCKEGYLNPKIEKYLLNIETAKKELTVEPYNPYSFGKKDETASFKIYQENDEYLSVPKFYGLKKFGKPDLEKELKGKKIKIKFKGELRPLQKSIVDHILLYIKIILYKIYFN